MPRTRFHYPIRVASLTALDPGSTIIRLDFGNACFGSLVVPGKIEDKESVRLFLECELVESNEG